MLTLHIEELPISTHNLILPWRFNHEPLKIYHRFCSTYLQEAFCLWKYYNLDTDDGGTNEKLVVI
jgi:hypothetical protein